MKREKDRKWNKILSIRKRGLRKCLKKNKKKLKSIDC